MPALARDHVDAWSRRWDAAEVRIDGDDEAQRALRFAVYHLIAAANPDDERVSIGARALTGDAYKGHVFWDTEIFMLPFYIFTDPAAARALLMYRYHTLAARPARRPRAWATAARSTPGSRPTPAKRRRRVRHLRPTARSSPSCPASRSSTSAPTSPTRSGSTGRRPATTRFLLEAGAEILLETARFWASRAPLEARRPLPHPRTSSARTSTTRASTTTPTPT